MLKRHEILSVKVPNIVIKRENIGKEMTTLVYILCDDILTTKSTETTRPV